VPFVDRAIPFAVSEPLDVDVETAEEHDERLGGRKLERILRGFIGRTSAHPCRSPRR
jgi:hypothetical protein